MSKFDSAMEALAQRFLLRCGNDLAELKECMADSSDRQAEVRHIVHRMSGSAGIFGYDQIGELAFQVDEELAAGQGATKLPALMEALATLLTIHRES